MTRSAIRAELLLATAALVAGALAGVVVQAAVEVARGRREQRGQLRAAGDLIDRLDAEAVELRRDASSLTGRLLAARGEAQQLRDQHAGAQQLAGDAIKAAADATARLDVIQRVTDTPGDAMRKMATIRRTLTGRKQPEPEPIGPSDRLPAPDELLMWEPNMTGGLRAGDNEGPELERAGAGESVTPAQTDAELVHEAGEAGTIITARHTAALARYIASGGTVGGVVPAAPELSE